MKGAATDVLCGQNNKSFTWKTFQGWRTYYRISPSVLKQSRDGNEHSWKTNTLICRPSEFYYQPGHPQSLISLRPSEERLTIKRPAKNAGPGKCWMLHPIGAQEVAGSILGSGPIVAVEIWSWNNVYGHSIQVRKLSVTDESMGTQYRLTA